MKTIKKIFEDMTLVMFMIMILGHLLAPFVMFNRCNAMPWPEILNMFNYVR